MSEAQFAEQDLLKLIEQGVTSSADKLASISHTDWSTQTVSIKTAPMDKFQKSMGKDDKEQCGAYFTMPGGVFLVMFPAKSSAAFANVFLPAGTKHPEIVKNRELEAMAEISNIVVNTVANTIADACDMAFFLSVPKLSKGSKQDLLKAAPDMISPPGEKFMIMAYVHMSSAALSSDCTIVVLLNAAWRQRLLAALG